MQGKLICFFVLTVWWGCKINKEKSELLHTNEQTQQGVYSNSMAWQFHLQDSNYRLWRFSSDSSFYFHPDSGLWGRGGQIVYSGLRSVQLQSARIKQDYDSIRTEINSVQEETYSKRTSNSLSSRLWLLVVIPIVALIIIIQKFRTKKKVFKRGE